MKRNQLIFITMAISLFLIGFGQGAAQSIVNQSNISGALQAPQNGAQPIQPQPGDSSMVPAAPQPQVQSPNAIDAASPGLPQAAANVTDTPKNLPIPDSIPDNMKPAFSQEQSIELLQVKLLKAIEKVQIILRQKIQLSQPQGSQVPAMTGQTATTTQTPAPVTTQAQPMIGMTAPAI